MKLAARLAIARLRSALNAPREARRRAPLRRAMARRNAGTIKDEGNSVYTFLLTLPIESDDGTLPSHNRRSLAAAGRACYLVAQNPRAHRRPG